MRMTEYGSGQFPSRVITAVNLYGQRVVLSGDYPDVLKWRYVPGLSPENIKLLMIDATIEEMDDNFAEFVAALDVAFLGNDVSETIEGLTNGCPDELLEAMLAGGLVVLTVADGDLRYEEILLAEGATEEKVEETLMSVFYMA